MARSPAQALSTLRQGFRQLSNAQKIGLLTAMAGLVAVVAVALLWVRTPDDRVLYSNLSERDGGEVIAALAQMNVPYRVADGGSVILAPGDRVYDLRLKLATQGLPKGGAVGFELMDAQKFGVSQFSEQVNYQRALAGELSRSIQSLASVQAARVHLAIPRPSGFVRELQQPSASVLVTLYPGRALDAEQVSAIQHLVAASVPQLSARQVTVVDQSGNLLTGAVSSNAASLDAGQLKYVQAVEAAYVARIENILRPIVGGGNVRAQIAAVLDFSETEQTSERYEPNSARERQAVRSQQTVEREQIPAAGSDAAGLRARRVPAPVLDAHRESTVNFELDKTVRRVKGEVGALKRLSAAVVVNDRQITDAGGSVTLTPRSERELEQIRELVREAIGFDAARGDTLNVVNAPFDVALAIPVETPAGWRALAERVGTPEGLGALARYGLLAVALLAALLAIRGIRRALLHAAQATRAAGPAAPAPEPATSVAATAAQGVDADLQAVRELAREQPRVVASVLREWMAADER